MHMPRPQDAHHRLARFAGTWEGKDTMAPSPWDPEGGTASAHTTNRVALDGFAIVRDYEQRKGDTVTFRGHSVLWWDAKNEEYVSHWWDSMGGAPNEFRGSFEGETLVLIDSGKGSTRVSMRVEGDTMHHEFAMSKDGGPWEWLVRGVYSRDQ